MFHRSSSDQCRHTTDASGHCLEPTCRNYARYTGERDRQAAIALQGKVAPKMPAAPSRLTVIRRSIETHGTVGDFEKELLAEVSHLQQALAEALSFLADANGAEPAVADWHRKHGPTIRAAAEYAGLERLLSDHPCYEDEQDAAMVPC